MAEKASTTSKTKKRTSSATPRASKKKSVKSQLAKAKKQQVSAADSKAKSAVSASPLASKKGSAAKTSKLELKKSPGSKKTPRLITAASLFSWNKWLALVYILQGALILVLSTGKAATYPLVTNFLAIDPLATSASDTSVLVPAAHQLADINLVYITAAFLFMAGIAHVVAATVYRKRYEANLGRGINYVRWIEYAFSVSTMLIAIGALVGVVSLAMFTALVALTVVMSLLGLAMEVVNQGRTKPNWLAYIVGCIAGLAPWVVFSEYLMSGALWGAAVPVFVYVIFATMFLLFAGFALNMYLQFAGIGKWKQGYLYSERAYMILGLVAKTALAWQLFAGILR